MTTTTKTPATITTLRQRAAQRVLSAYEYDILRSHGDALDRIALALGQAVLLQRDMMRETTDALRLMLDDHRLNAQIEHAYGDRPHEDAERRAWARAGACAVERELRRRAHA